jgi:starch synthase
MKDKRILYVSSEVVPYLAEVFFNVLMFQNGCDQGGQIRIFMPRYGNINEKKTSIA